MTHEWLMGNPSSSNFKTVAERTSPNNFDTSVSKPKTTPKQYKAISEAASEMHHPLNPEHKKISEKEVAGRNIHQWNKNIAEGVSLKDLSGRDHSLLQRMLRTLSQWKLGPNQLIYEVSKELDQLENPSFHSLFSAFSSLAYQGEKNSSARSW